jgi:hypothetical protein
VPLWDAEQGASAQALDFITSVLPDLDANDRLDGARRGKLREPPLRSRHVRRLMAAGAEAAHD